MSEFEDRGTSIEHEEEFDEESSAKGGLPPIVKLLLLVVVVAGLGVGAFFLATKIIVPKITDSGYGDQIAERRRLKAIEKAEKALGPLVAHQINDITANLAGGRGRQFVNLGIIIELRESSLQDAIDKDYMIRDALLNYFSGRTLAEMSQRNFQASVKDTLRGMINAVLDGSPVDSVYFTNILIQ